MNQRQVSRPTIATLNDVDWATAVRPLFLPNIADLQWCDRLWRIRALLGRTATSDDL